MKNYMLYILIFFLSFNLSAQSEFHVFPTNHKITPGTDSGNGSAKLPWSLKTALLQKHLVGGDIIWIHEGIYNGRFVCKLESTNKKIMVSAFKDDKVVLNGNVTSNKKTILEVRGANVIFKNFEVTLLGDFARNIKNKDFNAITGVNHLDGEDCEFINLKIYNVTGIGIGSWKRTGGTLIEGCTIFNNGFIGKQRGHGVGIYVQNQSDKIRLIKNNTIFNNYYKGIEVWDASAKTTFQYVKNVTLTNNIIFNNGLPSGTHRANIIIASDDRNGLNVAKNIIVKDNVLYHNSDFLNDSNNFGNGVSLTLGYNVNSPVENVIVDNNIIIGKNNALNILYAKDLVFKNNSVYCGYIHFNKSALQSLNSNKWKFSNNKYYSRRSNAFRVLKHHDYSIKEWQTQFNIDAKSQRKHIKNFDLKKVLDITKIKEDANFYRVTLFDKNGENVKVDFSNYKIKNGTAFKIKNIANNSTIKSGKVSESFIIDFPMSSYNNTVNNFGVYTIEFTTSKEKKKSFFKRIFGWLF